MRVIEVITDSQDLTLRQRWAHLFTMLVAVALLLFGLNLRNGIFNATVLFDSPEAGIQALYPENWLIDTLGDYVFRVRDMTHSGYKTTIEVAVRPIGADTQERNIADRLTLDRLQTFTDYAVQPAQPYTLPSGISGQSVSYTYVNRNASPFLASIPSVVRGLDVLVVSGGQVIIMTYRADRTIFDQEFERFEQFLRDIQF